MKNPEKDSFESINVGYIAKSTILPKEDKKLIFGLKKNMVKQSLQIQFGFNQKKDNFSKTKQLNLF